MIQLACPICRIDLLGDENERRCPNCSFILKNEQGIWVDTQTVGAQDKDFYENIYNDHKGQQWLQGLNRHSLLKRILERLSLSYRRERFFRRYLKGQQLKILDLACGAGRDYFKQFGEVAGIDLIYSPLVQAKQIYQILVQGEVARLPFPDNYFDYVISSDLFGHIRVSDKNQVIKEIERVLKPGGLTLNVIETDSTNYWFKVAHRYPELFQKYFIEQIGGHVGLELPDICVARWQQQGFVIKKAIKIWGLIWPVQDYLSLFNNEYQRQSVVVKILVWLASKLAKIKLIREVVNIILNPLNSLIETLTPLDDGQGLMMVCQKKY